MDRAALEAEVKRRVWFHTFEIAPSLWTPGHYQADPTWLFAEMRLPESMRGLRALDMGCADGLFALEMARRGADVTAVDLFSPDFRNVEFLSRLWSLPVRYVQSTVYEFRDEPFDIVLAMGVLYHLQHPLLGLQCLNALTRETLILESHVIESEELTCTFYPREELNSDPSNWWSPTKECLKAMLRACGFEIEHWMRPAPSRRLARLRRARATPPALGVQEVFMQNYGHPAP